MPRHKQGKRRLHLIAAAKAKWAKCDAAATESVASKKPAPSPSDSDKSASRRKIEIMNPVAYNGEVEDQNWTLLHVFQLTRLMSDPSCPECGETGLSVSVREREKAGFAAKLAMCCDGCGYEKCEFSSPRTGFNDKKNTGFEVNNRMTMLSHELGGSYTALQTFSTVMGIPGMHLKTFQAHDKKVTAAEIESGSTLLERTAATIQQAYAETDEDLQGALDKGENPVINISVSYDGTWQKRGFTSLYGTPPYDVSTTERRPGIQMPTKQEDTSL
ncbi:uncharacterized protein LOC143298248 [Babylonia areolata]|uniref:uncharacterized protein LOC143298248 n=1 Tax=Babylonia areolata TaxID=304850 RepID=UPI003FD0C52C